MNKPFKVLSSVALASVMSVSALTPVAAAENTQEQINVQEFIFENHEGYTVKVSLDMYNAAFDLGAIDTKNNKFVKGTDNQYYSINKYNAAFDIAGTPEGAMKILAEKNQHEIDVEEDKIYSAEFNKDTKQFDAIIDDQPSDEVNKDALNEAIAEAEALEGEQAEAVEEALTAAKAVAEDEKATQEDVDAAAEALKDAIAEATKEPEEPAEDKIAVAKVEAVNEGKEVTVTLKEDLPEDTDLEGATITLTDAEGNTIEATIKEETEATGKVFTFVLPEGKELVDAEKYTVTSELFADAELTAKLVAPYPVEFSTPTEKVVVYTKDGNKAVTDIVIEAKDQYGETYDLTVEAGEDNGIEAAQELEIIDATLNGMPLVNDEIKIDKGVVTLTKASAKKDDKLVFKVGYTKGEGDDKKEYVSEPIKRTLIEGEAPALTYIKGIKANKETVKPRETVTLTAEVTDQYGNPIKAGDQTIRWVIKKGQDLITQADEENTPFDSAVVTNGSTFTYKAKDSGDVEIEAYIVSTAETTEPYKVTIGEIEVDELKFEPVSGLLTTTNQAKDPIKLGELTVNDGAKLDPSTVKFEVTKAVTNDETGEVENLPVEEGDVEVEAVFELDDDGEKTDKIIVQAKANKSGEYTVTPYINEDVKAKNSATFTSDVKAAINKIDVKPDEEKEYKVGTPLELPIAFYNEFDELVQGDTEAQGNAKNKVTLTSSNKDIVTVELENVEKDGQETEQQQLVIKATAPGTSVITVQSGDVYKTFKVKFVQAELTTIKVADKKLEGLIANDKEAVYTDLTFFDQHEEEMDFKELDSLQAQVKLGEEAIEKGVKAEVVEVYTDKDDEIVEVTEKKPAPEGTKTRKAVKVTADSKDSVIKPGDYTVEVSVKENDKVKPVTFTVEVKEAREVKDIKAEPKSSTVVLGSPVTVDVTVTDQYGEAFDLPEGENITAQLIDLETEEVVEEITVNKVDSTDVKGKYTTTFKPEKLGTYDLVFTYTKGDGEDKVEVTETVAVHVGLAADVVKSIEFADFEDEETERVMIKDGKPVYKSTKDQTYTLTPKAKDADGNPVNFDAKELTWTSSDPSLVTVNGGEVTVVGTPSTEEGDQKVTVTAKMLDVSQSITFVVSADSTPKALPESITMTVPTEEATLEVTEVTIDENATDGAIEVTYTAVDQFGKDFAVDFTDTKIESFNPTVAEAVQGSEKNTIKITAVGESKDGTRIRTTIDGNDVDLKVIVKKEAVVIAQDAKTLAEALPKVPGVQKGEPLTIEGKDTKPSAKAVKEAVETKIDAEENGIAVEVVNATDDQDVARSTQEDVDGQDTEDETTTVEYKVTLSKGDAEKQELTVYAQFVLDAETEAANALEQAKKAAIADLKQQFPAENYTVEGEDGNKATYEAAMEAAETAINAAETIEAVNDAKGTQVTALNAIKTDDQLTQKANEEAAEAALTKAKEAAEKVGLVNAESDVTEDSAKTAIEEAIKEALKNGEDEFAGKVEVTVEENGFTAATNGTSEQTEGVKGSIKFKITITVGEGDVEGTATSAEAIELKIQPKAFVPETGDNTDNPGEGSGEEGTSGENQTDPETTQP